MKIDHVGWIVRSISEFEALWCEILGYQCVHTSRLTPEMSSTLFDISAPAEIKRYSREGSVDIEIHHFPYDIRDDVPKAFSQQGINHICIHTGGPGSRDKLLARLIGSYHVRRFQNPRGWENIFVLDTEGNWIELRETL